MAGAAALVRADRALFSEGSLLVSREWYGLAFTEARAAGDGPTMARAALGLGGLWVHEDRLASSAAATEAYQRQALRAVGADSVLGLRLRARLAAESDYRTGRGDRVLATLAETRESDAVAHAEALSLAHHCLLGPDHAETREALADELMVAAAESGRPIDALIGLVWGTVDRYLVGDPMADRWLTELEQRLRSQRHQAVRFVLDAMTGMVALRAGGLAEAEALAERCARPDSWRETPTQPAGTPGRSWSFVGIRVVPPNSSPTFSPWPAPLGRGPSTWARSLGWPSLMPRRGTRAGLPAHWPASGAAASTTSSVAAAGW